MPPSNDLSRLASAVSDVAANVSFLEPEVVGSGLKTRFDGGRVQRQQFLSLLKLTRATAVAVVTSSGMVNSSSIRSSA